MKHLKAAEIIELIEAPHKYPIIFFLRKHAPVKEVLKALESSTSSRSRHTLCNLLGYQRAKSGIPLLITAMDDTDQGVRCAAAESLGKIGDPRAGDALFNHFREADTIPDCTSLAVALGAVRHQAAVPVLVASLEDDNPDLRGCAAWSLGVLEAIEALEPLKTALAKEKAPWARQRIQEAIAIISARHHENAVL